MALDLDADADSNIDLALDLVPDLLVADLILRKTRNASVPTTRVKMATPRPPPRRRVALSFKASCKVPCRTERRAEKIMRYNENEKDEEINLKQ